MEASGQLFHPPALWQDWLHRLFPSLIIGYHILPWILFPRLHELFLVFYSIAWTVPLRMVKDFLHIQHLGFLLKCSAKCPLLSLLRNRVKIVLTFHISLEKCVACPLPPVTQLWNRDWWMGERWGCPVAQEMSSPVTSTSRKSPWSHAFLTSGNFWQHRNSVFLQRDQTSDPSSGTFSLRLPVPSQEAMDTCVPGRQLFLENGTSAGA